MGPLSASQGQSREELPAQGSASDPHAGKPTLPTASYTQHAVKHAPMPWVQSQSLPHGPVAVSHTSSLTTTIHHSIADKSTQQQQQQQVEGEAQVPMLLNPSAPTTQASANIFSSTPWVKLETALSTHLSPCSGPLPRMSSVARPSTDTSSHPGCAHITARRPRTMVHRIPHPTTLNSSPVAQSDSQQHAPLLPTAPAAPVAIKAAAESLVSVGCAVPLANHASVVALAVHGSESLASSVSRGTLKRTAAQHLQPQAPPLLQNQCATGDPASRNPEVSLPRSSLAPLSTAQGNTTASLDQDPLHACCHSKRKVAARVPPPSMPAAARGCLHPVARLPQPASVVQPPQEEKQMQWLT